MPPTPPGSAGLPEFDVVILAGGRATRLGGADKPGLVVGTSTMAAVVARAEPAELADSLSGGLTVVREDPPGSGPVPALRTCLREARAPWVAVLAADLPFLRGEHVRDLLTVASRQTPGAEP